MARLDGTLTDSIAIVDEQSVPRLQTRQDQDMLLKALKSLEPSTRGIDIRWTIRHPKMGIAGDSATRLLHIYAARSSASTGPAISCPLPGTSYIPRNSQYANKVPLIRPVDFLLKHLADLATSHVPRALDLLFLLPYMNGYIVRSDFLDLRLKDLETLQETVSFVEPLKYCQAAEIGSFDTTDLYECLENSVSAAIFVQQSAKTKQEPMVNDLYRLLDQRLDYPWLSKEPIPRKRVALVRGRPSLKVGRRVYQAASALGVDLVIVDEGGHWLEPNTDVNKELREAFLEVNMSEDLGLADRITDALETYPLPIHGIFTLSDNYLVHVARVAEKLDLPTSPSTAHEIAVDKHLTRALCAESTQFARVEDASELAQLIADRTFIPAYPVIVKPRTRAWSSNFVFKASDETELLHAAGRVCSNYTGGALVEPYYDGPEIDVNFVLLNGKPLYQEIVDELPCKGDLEDGITADFLESGMSLPTIFPEDEKSLIYASVLKTLTQLGFSTGVFHVEARLSGSRMSYQSLNSAYDLTEDTDDSGGQLDCHLIEINARPPGLVCQIATSHTFGVDYFAARILSAISDHARLKMVCKSFKNTEFPDGAQYWSQLVFPAIPQGATFLNVDPFTELAERCPGIALRISDSSSDFNVGGRLPNPEKEAAAYIGHCLVVSRQSRSELMKTASELRREVRIG